MREGINWSKLAKWIFPVLGLVIFIAAFFLISHFLKEHSYHDLRESFRSIPLSKIWLASLLTALSYAILTCYDLLACRQAGIEISKRKILFTSFCSFAISNSIGLANLAGGSIRMRLYSAFGAPVVKIIQVIAFVSSSFFLGFFALAGVTFLFEGLSIPSNIELPEFIVRWVGVALLGLVGLYLFYSATAKRTLKLGAHEFEVPSLGISTVQLVVASADWALSAVVLFVLLPEGTTLAFGPFLSIYLSAQIIALLTHVPGGLGVLEAVMIYFLVPDHHATPEILATLMVFRLIYYFAPLLLGGFSLLSYEIHLRRTGIGRVSKRAFRILKPIAPLLSGVLVFAAGAVLVYSGTTPNIGSRSRLLREVLPLPVVEMSHFIGSCIGVALLAISISLINRTRAAWTLAVPMLILGALVSLSKGLDFEEASLLSVFAVYLYYAKSEFYRPARLFRERLEPGWLIAVTVVIGSAIWLGFFANRHVAYSEELWWHFSFNGNAPRFLRATAGMFITLIGFFLLRLLGSPNQPENVMPVPLEDILPLVLAAPDTTAYLALLGDKQIFTSPDKRCFLMYAVKGRTWVVLGDPIGDRNQIEDLIYEFRMLADQFGGQVVFYQVQAKFLAAYIDLGMMFLKLGEEAKIVLPEFTLEGGTHKTLRQALNKLRKANVVFRIVQPNDWSTIAESLRRVSDKWLGEKNAAEKGFSLGYFDEAYLRRFPTAVLELDGKILAFANLWEGGEKIELSIDLMRFDPDGPGGLMEQLTTEIILWGRDQGYRYFNLGMAPLSGLATGKHGSNWNRVGSLLFEHAEHFYNFKGLRRYKEKYHPEWSPRFLAYSSKLTLPIALKDLTSLISGGVKGSK